MIQSLDLRSLCTAIFEEHRLRPSNFSLKPLNHQSQTCLNFPYHVHVKRFENWYRESKLKLSNLSWMSGSDVLSESSIDINVDFTIKFGSPTINSSKQQFSRFSIRCSCKGTLKIWWMESELQLSNFSRVCSFNVLSGPFIQINVVFASLFPNSRLCKAKTTFFWIFHIMLL